MARKGRSFNRLTRDVTEVVPSGKPFSWKGVSPAAGVWGRVGFLAATRQQGGHCVQGSSRRPAWPERGV